MKFYYKMSLFTTEIFNPKNFIEIDNVRIIPPAIEFKNGFPGRNFKAVIKIQNFSDTKAFVRITSPSSYAFKIKAIPRGMELSPGLSIVRTVCFTYTCMSVQLSFIPVYINDKRHNIEMIVQQPASDIKFFPESLNFGTIDAGYSSTARTLLLHNIGSKASRFGVDLTKNRHQILIEPNNGLLQPNTEIKLRMRLMGTKEGPLNTTLWIKCDTPFFVPISGKVIIPKFEVIHPNASEMFTVLDFPATYIGVSCSQTLLIRNYSQSGAMFCVLGEVKKKNVSYEEAAEWNPEFKYFAVNPREGSFEPNETKIFHVTFSPTTPGVGKKILDYYMCVYKVSKIRAKYMNTSDYIGGIYATDDEYYCSASSRQSIDLSRDIEAPSTFSSKSVEYEERGFNNFVRLYVHATAEEAKVTVIPDQLYLANLLMKQKELRVLEFTNNSNKLPIILRYKKVMYITMEKPTYFLKPSEILQTVVTISSQKIGVVKSQIDFELLFHDVPKTDNEYKVIGYLSVPIVFETSSVTKIPPPKFNPGIVPKYLKEVGKFCNDIRFNSTIEKPKTAVLHTNKLKVKSHLIAFPNDMQRSIRPWRNKNQCSTIFTNLPRYSAPYNEDYELTVFDREFKMEVSKYYNNYTKTTADQLRSKLAKKKPHHRYQLTDMKLRFCTDLACETVSPIKLIKQSKLDFFLPLSPAQMNKITITPETVHSGKIAAHHSFSFLIQIANENSFPIRVVMKPDKSVLIFPDGNQVIVGAKHSTDVKMVYMSSSIGYYSVVIDLIINESMVFQVTLLADVSPKSLQLDLNSLEFQELESHKYIDIYNPFNTHVNFYWSVQNSNIIVKPDRGCVQANKYLTCMVYLSQVVTSPLLSEIEFNSGDRSCQLVRIVVQKTIKLLFFPNKNIKLPNLPLNMPVTTEVIIQNSDNSPHSFRIINPEPIPGVSMKPKFGEIQGNSEWVCYVHTLLTSCINFTCTIKVEMEKNINIELVIEGTVVYPDISVFPKQIIFKKNPSSYFDVIKFAIENKSSAIASVKIDMTIYPEFTISESECAWSGIIGNEIILYGRRSKTLFLHYKPMYVASGSFYLPIVVNNILGPPISTDLITTKVAYFMETSNSSVALTPMPKNICCVKVQSYSTEPKLTFSKSNLYFQYNFSSNSFKENYIKISNTQKDSEEFCIRTDDLKGYFALSHSTGKELTIHDSSIVCNLDPTENVELKVWFNPIEFGDFRAVLPVYLRSDMSTKMHKYISLRATYPQPAITFENPPIYMTAIPLNMKFTRFLTLQMKNHNKNCAMKEFVHIEGLSLIRYEYSAERNEAEYKISYTLQYIAKESCAFNTTILFKCNCGSKYELPIIGCAENCFLTNYGFSEYYSQFTHILEPTVGSSTNMSMDTDSLKEVPDPPYPSFCDTRNFIHMNFMTAMLKATEFWVSKQAFFGTSFYKIPDGFVNINFKPDTICEPPFVKLLLNLVGPQINELLNLRPPPKITIDRDLYVHAVYKKALAYLKNLGAHCPQIQPEYLLAYTSYERYTRYVTQFDMPKIMPEEDFIMLSRQTWLDLILQTYKVLILYRLNTCPKMRQYANIKDFPMNKFQSFTKESQFENVFSEVEITLLRWLEFHFNDMKAEIWEDNVPYKEINNFSQNLSDSLVFAAVTAAYCPYLIKHFKNLYIEPCTYEENLHNAIKVTQAWDLLNFSFSVLPTEIADPNSIHILLLVSYLYVVLPTLYPLEVITFKTGLSLNETKSLSLANKNNFTIGYEIILLNNGDGCFSVNKPKLILEQSQKLTLSIKYHARLIKNVEAVLILSGECYGLRYAKSKTITLLGNPDLTYFTSTMTIPTYLYNIYELSLTCKSPYANEGYYKLQITYKLPENAECLSEMPYIEEAPKITVNRVTFINKDIFFDENGNGVFDVLICGLNPFDRTMYLYFTNKDIGDFAIQIHGVINNSYKGETIDVAIPKCYSSSSVHTNISNMIYINLPCQNRTFWDTTKKFILRMVEGDELEFWIKNIYTPTGIHVLRHILVENNILCMQNVCQKNKKYKLTVPRNACVTLPQYIVIEDECSTNHMKIPITFSNSPIKNFSFRMESCDGLILRIVSLNFVYS